MPRLLVITVGQTDVQLVENGKRREIRDRSCGKVHDEIERRTGHWSFVEVPLDKAQDPAERVPHDADFLLCTPKLDAVLAFMGAERPEAVLVLETRRDADAIPGDPRFAGALLESRLRGLGINDVTRTAFLLGRERAEDPAEPRDAVVRREVVARIDAAIRSAFAAATPKSVVVAATGGLPAVSGLVEEAVLLHAGDVPVELLEIADRSRATPPARDIAVPRRRYPEPAASYRARRHGLDLVSKGNLLGAWGAVEEFVGVTPTPNWVRVFRWLADFATSMPMDAACDIPVLVHPRMTARMAIRVEAALLAEDIPRAIHSTVALLECALWDHLAAHITPTTPPSRYWRVEPEPEGELVRSDGEWKSARNRPFERSAKRPDLFRIHDESGCALALARGYLRRDHLVALCLAIEMVRHLRNDVAHNEPTPATMQSARQAMSEAGLWSSGGRLLGQPLVTKALQELSVISSATLFDDLLADVRRRVMDAD